MGDTRAPQFQGVLIAFLILSTISVAARIYTRVTLVRIFAVEDWLTVVTFVRLYCSALFMWLVPQWTY
jgi:hypothetical protein